MRVAPDRLAARDGRKASAMDGSSACPAQHTRTSPRAGVRSPAHQLTATDAVESADAFGVLEMIAKLPGRVSIEENVVYGTGGGRDLHCDVFTPPDARTRPHGRPADPRRWLAERRSRPVARLRHSARALRLSVRVRRVPVVGRIRVAGADSRRESGAALAARERGVRSVSMRRRSPFPAIRPARISR